LIINCILRLLFFGLDNVSHCLSLLWDRLPREGLEEVTVLRGLNIGLMRYLERLGYQEVVAMIVKDLRLLLLSGVELGTREGSIIGGSFSFSIV